MCNVLFLSTQLSIIDHFELQFKCFSSRDWLSNRYKIAIKRIIDKAKTWLFNILFSMRCCRRQYLIIAPNALSINGL